jgi:hypothetical protein
MHMKTCNITVSIDKTPDRIVVLYFLGMCLGRGGKVKILDWVVERGPQIYCALNCFVYLILIY